MKKLFTLLLMVGFICLITTACSDSEIKENEKDSKVETVKGDEEMHIYIKGENNETIVFKLNDSTAAKSLYNQVPMTIDVENFGTNEKIFYPPEELDIRDTPMAKGPAGTLAYYEPWGDVVMYYGDCGGASGLYALGEAITNGDKIQELSGTIEITKDQDTNPYLEIEEDNNSIETEELASENQKNTVTKMEQNMYHVQLLVGEQSFTASLYNTSTVKNLIERLPLSLEMGELHGNEKYYYFSDSFPTDAQNGTQINTGDLKLYGNDCLVLFYKDFQTSYAYTSLGQVDNVQGLAQALGNGKVEVFIKAIEE